MLSSSFWDNGRVGILETTWDNVVVRLAAFPTFTRISLNVTVGVIEAESGRMADKGSKPMEAKDGSPRMATLNRTDVAIPGS
ncbi:MAG: hypothetical protein WA705_31620 [Candidatus Ozemobacteraceae bacterium]